MTSRLPFVTSLLLAVCSASVLAETPAMPIKPKFGPNPKVREMPEYPFVQAPERTMRTALWQNYDELPAWCQRGNIRYFSGAHNQKRVDQIAELEGIGHCGPIRVLTPEHMKEMKRKNVPLIIRLDGQFFWGRNYTQINETSRPGGWAAYHVTVPNTRWFSKFPRSLSATKVLRDGELLIEYYGSNWVQRRDVSYVNPVSIQMRDAFLRECVLGEQVFDYPLDIKTGGHASGVWWDNPGNVVVSYDPYATWLVAKAFEKRFGDRYNDRDGKKRGRNLHEPWYNDPPHFWMRYHDREVRRWYETFWADAYAGYYSWQYKFLQNEIAPKLGKKHLFVGGNSKLNWSTANWDYYLYSWPETYDVLGPNETSPVYTNKEAPGLKLALAASNGKPAGIWRAFKHPGERGEILTCLAVSTNQPAEQARFQIVNRDVYHNAMPGGRVAVLYHLLDGLHVSPIANHARVCDQVWRAGCALEVITELHLTPQVLKQFDVLVLLGFRFSDDEIAAIKAFVEGGGKVLSLGDNRDHEGRQLSEILGGIDAFTDGKAEVGRGVLQAYGTQLITQKEMTDALERLDGTDYRIVAPRGRDLMLNVLTQPKAKLTTVHVVNYTEGTFKNVKVKLPKDVDTRHVAVISPSGRAHAAKVSGDTVNIPTLIGYAVLVVCPDAATRDAVVKRNGVFEDKPVPGKLDPGRHRHSAIADAQIEPDDLKAGRRVAHLRQSGRAGFRRVDADVVTAGRARVGKAHPIKMKLHALGVWSPRNVHFRDVKFVLVNVETGERQEVAVDVGEVKGTEEGFDMRQRKDFYLPTGTLVRRETTTEWTPAKPGRYQVYLGYRYASEVYDGQVGRAARKKQHSHYRMEDHMFGRPFEILSYEERLPCLVVDVSPAK